MADLFDLTGRVAVVTGGSRGLGRAMVLAFAEHGADVVIASRKLDACEALAEQVRRDTGREALAVQFHAGKWEDADRLADTVYERFGRCDVLVNNAGMSPLYPSLAEVSEELFDKVLGVNFKGPFRLCALLGERMAAAGGGSIINVSSIAAVQPTPTELVYAGAKAALNAMSIGIAHAYGPERALQRDHAGAVPHRHQPGVGHGGVREAGAVVHPPAARRRAGGGRRRGALPRQRRLELHHRGSHQDRRWSGVLGGLRQWRVAPAGAPRLWSYPLAWVR